MLLKKGMKGSQVKDLQHKLNQVGYPCGYADGIFGRLTEFAVEQYQDEKGLTVDGVVGPQTWGSLFSEIGQMHTQVPTAAVDTYEEVIALESKMPQTAVDKRMSEAIKMMQLCDDGQGCRYGGWINPYMFDKDKFDEEGKFPIPLVGRVVPGNDLHKPIHGGTCSPWAGLFLGWWLGANQDYNFRIGRSARWIATWDEDHVKKGTLIPGYGPYSEVHGKLKLEKRPLNILYEWWEWLNQVNIIEMDHHIILVLKVGGEGGLNLEDPYNPGQPVPAGLYRLGADGFYPRRDWDGDGKKEKYYSGTKQTFRRLKALEKTTQGWDAYRLTDLDTTTAMPTTGPWAGRPAWQLTLEE